MAFSLECQLLKKTKEGGYVHAWCLGEDKHLSSLKTPQEGKVPRLCTVVPGHFLSHSSAPVKKYLASMLFFS